MSRAQKLLDEVKGKKKKPAQAGVSKALKALEGVQNALEEVLSEPDPDDLPGVTSHIREASLHLKKVIHHLEAITNKED